MTKTPKAYLTSLTKIELTSEDFTRTVVRLIDEDKPDPLQARQMRKWTWGWKQQSQTENKGANAITNTNPGVAFKPTHTLCGVTEWHGEHMMVELTTECSWQGDKDSGSLFFSCEAKSFFRDLNVTGDSDDKMTATKVLQKIQTRLKKDDYISKLTNGMQICQASIKVQPEELEERVHCSEMAAEAVRRAVFSTADSPLDVFDLVCRLPILPCTFHKDTGSLEHCANALADRAKLRLLEDATYDACENEAEDELVETLKIGTTGDSQSKRQKR